MKPRQVVRLDSDDGDTHFVFIDLKSLKKNNFAQNYNEIEAKKQSKMDASKPLNLKRTE
jgi:Holliday junction resolvase-like predicted endonuclease